MSTLVRTAIESARSDPFGVLHSHEEYLFLFQRLEREQARDQAHARAWELAKRQGVSPIRSIEDLQGDFWPEEESVDEFLDWVQATRQQDKARSELE